MSKSVFTQAFWSGLTAPLSLYAKPSASAYQVPGISPAHAFAEVAGQLRAQMEHLQRGGPSPHTRP